MTTQRVDPRVGSDLGPYHIEAVIARGGMGVVYLAEERRLKRRVALKVLPPELAEDEDFRARFERESQMAAAIDDPNILPVYEAGEVDGVLFIAMRYVEGTDLEARLRSGPMEPVDAVRLLGQVGSALDAAHLRGLVHRDVKPANILIAPGSGDERGEHAYLSDFGLTKLRTQDTSLTRVGAIMGTLDTMAPEQLEGREVTGAADQYALATVAHRALTGAPPFARDSEASLITAILRDPPPSASAERPELPPAVDAVLARGLAKRPEDRFPSCAAFVAELRRALGITAMRSLPEPAARYGDRRRLAAVAGALVVVVVVAVIVGLALGGGSGPTGTAAPESPAIGAEPSANPDPSAFPNADEAALLGFLPADIAPRCRRGSYDNVTAQSGASSRPLVSLDCLLAPGGVGETVADRLQVRQLRPSQLVTADRVVSRAAGDRAVPEGDCTTDMPAIGSWSIGSTVVGQATCWIDGADAVVEWSHDRDGLVFRVARGNRDESGAVGLWQSIREAAWTALREANGGEDPDVFPTELEAELLDGLPTDLAETCRRGELSPLYTENAGQTVLPLAGLTCALPAGSGADVLEIRRLRHDPNFSPESVIGGEARVRSIEPGDCATSGRAHGRWSIGDREVGALVCYRIPDGRANVSWTRSEGDLYLWATRDDGDQQRLWAWFTDNARFIGE